MKRNIVKQIVTGLTISAGLLAATVVSQAAYAEDIAANTNEAWVLVHPITKGSSGAGWVRVRATMQDATQTSPALAMSDEGNICRPVKFFNNKGARSVAPGQKLIRCAGVDGKRAHGAPYCTANLPCANGSMCSMKMTCAQS